MQTLVYDGSFTGFLTAVFEVYEYKITGVNILPLHRQQPALFGELRQVHTDEAKAGRAAKGLKQHVSGGAFAQFYKTFLSEKEGMENLLLAYMQHALGSPVSVETDYSHPAVLFVSDTAKKVHREKHRMEAFVRFKKTKDSLFYAVIEPDFNVLPLIEDHFEKRYADQLWLIYDLRRNYGIYYDLQETSVVELDMKQFGHTKEESVLDEQENKYGKMWQDYFNSVNIKERKNKKLHQRHMPLRYWKYLTEKKTF